jgi:hypothetical protein
MAELETLQMLIDGQWCAASDGAAFDCIDPSTGLAWARIPEATYADVNRAVEAAATALDGPWGAMTPTQRGKHLARLIIIGIDRLLTENNEVYTLFLYNRFQEFGNGEGFKRFIVLNKNAPVGAERERSAYLLLTLCRTNRYRDNLIRSSGFLHADSLFNGNFTERIDCHLGIGEVDTCPV